MSDITPMTADEVFTRAKLGSLIRFYNDEAKPARHHKQKMRDWKRYNGMGYLIQLKPGLETRPKDRPTFTVQERIGTDHTYDLDSTLMFDVRPPAPGTILAYTELDGIKTVRHVWYGVYEAYKWARTNGADLDHCGLKYLLVRKDRKQVPHRIPKEFAALQDAITEVIQPCFT